MQRRSNTGKEFEEEIAKKYGKRVSKSPKIVWNGEGKTNLDKILNLNFDEKLFFPTEKSNFLKYDLIDSQNCFHEIKKYLIRDVSVWKLYSEPIIKISTKQGLSAVSNKFGGGDIDLARIKYNEFIKKLFIHTYKNGILDHIQSEMTQSTKGMIFIDGYVEMKNIDFQWKVYESAWMEFHRITLEFKLK